MTDPDRIACCIVGCRCSFKREPFDGAFHIIVNGYGAARSRIGAA